MSEGEGEKGGGGGVVLLPVPAAVFGGATVCTILFCLTGAAATAASFISVGACFLAGTITTVAAVVDVILLEAMLFFF